MAHLAKLVAIILDLLSLSLEVLYKFLKLLDIGLDKVINYLESNKSSKNKKR